MSIPVGVDYIYNNSSVQILEDYFLDSPYVTNKHVLATNHIHHAKVTLDLCVITEVLASQYWLFACDRIWINHCGASVGMLLTNLSPLSLHFSTDLHSM